MTRPVLALALAAVATLAVPAFAQTASDPQAPGAQPAPPPPPPGATQDGGSAPVQRLLVPEAGPATPPMSTPSYGRCAHENATS